MLCSFWELILCSAADSDCAVESDKEEQDEGEGEGEGEGEEKGSGAARMVDARQGATFE